LEKIEMKKTLVAVAALAAVSGAMAEVSITGVMEAAISTKDGVTSVIGGTNGTEVDFNVSDDLGGGIKAMATYSLLASLYDGKAGSIGTSSTKGASVNSYNSFIGLESADFGSVKLGEQFSPTFNVSGVGDVNGRAAISSYQAGGLTAQVANSLTYATPAIMGLVVQYQKVLDNTISAAQGKGYQGYSLTYTNGGLTAAFGGASKSTNGTTGSLSEQVAGASYDFGVAKVHAGWSGKTDVGASASGVGVKVPFGAFAITVGTSKQGAITANDYTGIYTFSKKTFAYLGVNTTSSQANATVFGVRHNF